MTTKVAVKQTIKNGKLISSVKDITTQLHSLSPFKKKLIIGYGILSTSTFIGKTYINGKEALIEARLNNEKLSANEEWLAVKNGCKQNTGQKFWESAIFPFTTFNYIMPSVIMALNTRQSPPTSEE